MRSNMKRRYIDSNVFIQAVLREDIPSQNVLKKIINKEIIALTSILSWDELVYVLRKFTNNEIATMEGKSFLMFPNLIFVEAKKEIIFKAQKLVEEYNLKPRDAIHLSTALSENCEEFISKDSDFDKIKLIKITKPKEF